MRTGIAIFPVNEVQKTLIEDTIKHIYRKKNIVGKKVLIEFLSEEFKPLALEN